MATKLKGSRGGGGGGEKALVVGPIGEELFFCGLHLLSNLHWEGARGVHVTDLLK